MEGSRSGSVVRRGMAVLALGAVIGGVFALSPASAAKFLTKKKATKLFLSRTVAYVQSPPVTVAPTAFASATAVCPTGFVVVGGGSSTDYSGDDAELEASYPSSTATVPSEMAGQTVQALGTNAWTVSVENQTGADALNFKALAVCVKGNASPALSGTPFRIGAASDEGRA
jgi:hypothetical protein